MQATRHRKTSKKRFEHDLINRHGFEQLRRRFVREEDAPLTLYYVDGRHCGTWTTGQAWEFDLEASRCD